MQLRLRTKFTLVMTSLVLFVVVVLSVVFAAQLLRRHIIHLAQTLLQFRCVKVPGVPLRSLYLNLV